MSEAARVEEPDPTPMMSPAQRDRRYRAAYTQGVQWARRGQYGQALGAFEEASTLKPDSLDALFNLGACHEAIGDPLKAIGIYRRIIDVTPDDPDCFANMGTSYIKMYHLEKSPVWRKLARKAWEQSLRLNPDQPDVKRYLAQSQSLD